MSEQFLFTFLKEHVRCYVWKYCSHFDAMNVKPISEDSSLSMGERKGKNNQPNKQANEKQTKKKALKHCSHF